MWRNWRNGSAAVVAGAGAWWNLPAAALQFPLANDIITSVIPGPREAAELRQILDWFKTPIPGAFWDELKSRDLLAADIPVPSGA